MSEQDDRSAAARLFDIRRIIGGLFVLYGVILFVAGLVDGADAKEQAADIDINVWTGLAMLAFGSSSSAGCGCDRSRLPSRRTGPATTATRRTPAGRPDAGPVAGHL